MTPDKSPVGTAASQPTAGAVKRAAKRARPVRRAPARAARAKAPVKVKRISVVSRAAADLTKGGRAIRHAIGRVGGLSKKTASRLARDWRAMDRNKKVRLVATLVAALGAAAAPLLRKALKK